VKAREGAPAHKRPKAAGVVVACERDEERAATLAARLRSYCQPQLRVVDVAGAGGLPASLAGGTVYVVQGDYLTLPVHSAALTQVTVAVCDPSCSGSGLKAKAGDAYGEAGGVVGAAPSAHAYKHGGGAAEHAHADADADGASGGRYHPVPMHLRGRVASLAAFQFRAVMHALSIPSLVRVVYSTCSLYWQENEGVVAAVLQAWQRDHATSTGMSLQLVRALPLWPRRGLLRPSVAGGHAAGMDVDAGALDHWHVDHALACIRVDPTSHDPLCWTRDDGSGGDCEVEASMCGFFACVLEKVPIPAAAVPM